MKRNPVGGRVSALLSFLCLLVVHDRIAAQPVSAGPGLTNIVIVEIERSVEINRSGATVWDPAQTNLVVNAGDRIRTGEGSRVSLRWSDQSIVRINELSDLRILPITEKAKKSGFSLWQGMLYFFHRDKPTDIDINTRTASAAVRGTEFNLEVAESGRTILTMLDGVVELRNEQGPITLMSDEQGIAEPGKAPTKTPLINAINVIQWALYYPAVLDLDELELTSDQQQVLVKSLTAYRSGDLLRALAEYPTNRTPASAAEKVYLGAVLLAVGQVERAGKLFDSVEPNAAQQTISSAALADALHQLIAAVKLQPWQRSRPAETATEWLAASYYKQSKADLPEALEAARNAVGKAPNFGFGWARLAELEFSFGRVPEAVKALEKSLELAPRNAEALALKGFLSAAQNRIREAIRWFEQAMAVDGALANAWLGRGLCRIRQGDLEGGREDLLVAAALEPQRALLRSYLGKAYGDAGDTGRATKELLRARKLDPSDPTAWLYLALLEQQNNQINDAVRDLEKSQELNNNRRVYRSRLLLDQDRAVRSANLANAYRDAGMTDVSVREAGRAVNEDYANYSAHLFLASSYDQLRDPNRINLRYETPAVSEYLIANLLAPVGAGILSQSISQQEYSKLFERDRLGLASSTEYLSRGAWVQSGAQFGIFGNFSYDLEAFYRTDPGQRQNNDFEERTLSLQFKQQLTSQDSIYVNADHYDAVGGDLIQYYDQSSANPGVRTREKLEPTVIAGYHHEWAPGVHTLFLAGRLTDDLSVADPAQGTFAVERTAGELDSVNPILIEENYRSKLEIYTVELQQLFQQPRHSTVLGARYQTGQFHTKNVQTNPSDFIPFFDPNLPAASQDIVSDFQRISIYAYHQWALADAFQLIGGLVYDRITFPENFRAAPVSQQQVTVSRFSPKAGLIWTPARNTTIRAAYTRSLAGASIDQSFQLEPSQVAGFLQSFRSVIPESVAGANAGARFETYGVSLEQKLGSRTYLGISGEGLNSKVRRTLGTFEITDVSEFFEPSGFREHIDYVEESLLFTLNQLIAEQWSVGARYQVRKSELDGDFTDVPDSAVTTSGFRPRFHLEAVLHQIRLNASYNHPSGFFSQFEALWNSQSNPGYDPDRPGDSFWQFNLVGGYRFPRRQAEVTVGVLNLADSDYRLNPLTLYDELPRGRTLVTRLRFSF
jgi:tetratricopeptide (TPR) repeat protein